MSMRDAWYNNVNYTRQVVIGTISKLKDVDAATARLLNATYRIGDLIQPYYGSIVRDQYVELVGAWNTSVINYAVASMTGKDLAAAKEVCLKSMDNLSSFMTRMDPITMSRANIYMLMTQYKDATLTNIDFRIAENWVEDINSNDRIHLVVSDLSDMLVNSVFSQYLDQFSK